MNPIDFALKRPYAVMVAVIAVILSGGLAVSRMSVDIFPSLNLPVICVCQPYGGMDPAQMEGLLTNYYEYHFLYIANIHHVESKNVQGMAVMKLFFHPGTNMAQAMAETIGYVTRSRAFMPPGTVSPFITRLDTGSAPVGYLVLSSDVKSINEIQDQALFKVRPMFAALPGVSAPPPFGGSQRTVLVKLEPQRLQSYAMAPEEVTQALASGNVISPSGVVRIDDLMPIVPVNALVKNIDELLNIPIRTGKANEPAVYLRDVATVKDGADVPVGYALVNGRRAVYILVTKRAEASTLSVVNTVKNALPDMRAVLPDDIQVNFEFDQSPTVTRAIRTLVLESVLGAGLIGLMVLLFLRDWRSAWIIVLNIPFALCGAVLMLWWFGQTLNLMTLGGLALAVGILVDESAVEIENIRTRIDNYDNTSNPARLSTAQMVREGNRDTAGPRFLALVCILAVFAPAFFMTGTASALFIPLSLAVGCAMVCSYLLSSTFVPVLAVWLLRFKNQSDNPAAKRRFSFLNRFRGFITAIFDRTVAWKFFWIMLYFASTVALIVVIGNTLGVELFPRVDAGRFQLRMEGPAGTRVEITEETVRRVLDAVYEEVGRDAVEISVGYAGLIPSSYPINAIYQWSGGPEEAILRVAMHENAGVDIDALKRKLRERLGAMFPQVTFSFEPADIVSDVMSFGSPTPIEVAVAGPNFEDTKTHTEAIRRELATLSNLRDLRYGQTVNYPAVRITIDRERAGASGVTPASIAQSLVTATSSSRFVVPNYWPDPKTGIGYQVQVEIPYEQINSIDDIAAIPLNGAAADSGRPLLLRDVAEITKGEMPGEYHRYNMKRMLTLTANLADNDLGRGAAAVSAAIARAGAAPKGVTIDIRGQVAPMKEILRGLGFGLIIAVICILLALTAFYQSVRLAVVALAAVPAVVLGIVLMLAATGTTLNLQSYMGSIMALGVSTANAIVFVSFAERARLSGLSAAAAARRALEERLRPILMTSLAMTAGMLPMALGLGEGGEQSAPLGRAVIGGLTAATFAILTVTPLIFGTIQANAGRNSASLHPLDPESSHYIGSDTPRNHDTIAQHPGDDHDAVPQANV